MNYLPVKLIKRIVQLLLLIHAEVMVIHPEQCILTSSLSEENLYASLMQIDGSKFIPIPTLVILSANVLF